MRDHNVAKACHIDFTQQKGRLLIVRMAHQSAYPLLELIRIAPTGQHADIVITLEQQCIAFRIGLNDVGRDMTEIRQNPDSRPLMFNHVLQWLARIVGHSHWLDAQCANLARPLTNYDVNARQKSKRAGFVRSVAKIYRHTILARERRYAVYVVRMFVSDEHSVYCRRIQRETAQAARSFLQRKAKVDEQCRVTSLNDRPITVTSAAE